MTKSEFLQAAKIAIVVIYGVLGLLAAFGPLAQYREWIAFAAGIVSIVASVVFGVNLKNDIAERKAGKQ